MLTMLTMFFAKLRSEEGQGLAEYALILVLVAIVCIGALIYLGTGINGVLNNVAQNMANPTAS